jgi:2-oxoisovalerate ferredoxin oxidoreductase alpha subunit
MQNRRYHNGKGDNIMSKTIIDTGNHIAGYACKYAKVEVVAAYPITPQSPVVEQIAEFVEKKEMDAEYIAVESEHSAMAALVGASLGGVRTFTATSAQGLALMHEMLHWASGARLPIVMAVVNRAMGPPWTIWSDLTDSLSQRDTGWIQIYCASNQEIFDTIIQTYKLCEDKRVLLPAMVCFEGFILSHTSMPVTIPDQKDIDAFLPPYKPEIMVDVDNPFTQGAIVSPDYYMEFRYLIQKAMENAKELIPQIEKEYAKKFGIPQYSGHIERYQCENADLILLSMGTIGSEAKITIDNLRKQGYKVGSARLRVFRPFPTEEIRKLAENTQMIAVIDRAISFGLEGPLYNEVKSVLYGTSDQPLAVGFITGLGGRDVTFHDIEKIAEKSLKWLKTGKTSGKTEWIGLKEVI